MASPGSVKQIPVRSSLQLLSRMSQNSGFQSALNTQNILIQACVDASGVFARPSSKSSAGHLRSSCGLEMQVPHDKMRLVTWCNFIIPQQR